MNIIYGYHYATKELMKLTNDGQSNKLEPVLEQMEVNPNLPFFAPGLIDIQINGYAGIDFNGQKLTVEEVKQASEELFKDGVSTYFPTIITNSPEFIEERLAIIAAAVNMYPICQRLIKGIHVEGPFISKEEGPRGAHPKEYIISPELGLIKRWRHASDGLLKLLTLSPEWETVDTLISYCVSHDILISIGHTAATTSEILKAIELGATCSTHLGNGAHVMLKRHPNYIWTQLSDSNLYASVIADGFHLPKEVLKVIFKVKQEKMILVSDATQFSGLKPGYYQTPIGGQVLLEENGRLSMANNKELLAGSAFGMMDMINYLVNHGVMTFEEAINCGSSHPRKYLEKVCQFKRNEVILITKVSDKYEVSDVFSDVEHDYICLF